MNETSPSKEKASKEALKPPSFLQVMMSVFAAALGVQKMKIMSEILPRVVRCRLSLAAFSLRCCLFSPSSVSCS